MDRSRTTLPVLALLLAATLWGTIWYPLRLLEDAGLAGLWATLVIYTAALVAITWPFMRRLGQCRGNLQWLILMALATGWCNVAFVLAVLEGTVVRVLLLFYLSPFWAVLLSRIFLGERLNTGARLVFVMAVMGALIMLWDPEAGMPWPRDRADWLALSSGIGFAAGNVMIRHLQTVSVWVKTGFSWLGALLICVIMLFLTAATVPEVSRTVWGAAAVLGLAGMVVMTLSVQYGVTHMPVYRSAIILLFELVAGASSSYWLSDEVVVPREWLGGGLIILAAYIAARMQSHHPET